MGWFSPTLCDFIGMLYYDRMDPHSLLNTDQKLLLKTVSWLEFFKIIMAANLIIRSSGSSGYPDHQISTGEKNDIMASLVPVFS